MVAVWQWGYILKNWIINCIIYYKDSSTHVFGLRSLGIGWCLLSSVMELVGPSVAVLKAPIKFPVIVSWFLRIIHSPRRSYFLSASLQRRKGEILADVSTQPRKTELLSPSITSTNLCLSSFMWFCSERQPSFGIRQLCTTTFWSYNGPLHVWLLLPFHRKRWLAALWVYYTPFHCHCEWGLQVPTDHHRLQHWRRGLLMLWQNPDISR